MLFQPVDIPTIKRTNPERLVGAAAPTALRGSLQGHIGVFLPGGGRRLVCFGPGTLQGEQPVLAAKLHANIARHLSAQLRALKQDLQTWTARGPGALLPAALGPAQALGDEAGVG